MAVYEARHHYPAAGVDLIRVAGNHQVLNTPRRTCFENASICDQNRTVGNQARVVQLRAAPWPLPTGVVHGEELPGTSDKRRASHGSTRIQKSPVSPSTTKVLAT